MNHLTSLQTSSELLVRPLMSTWPVRGSAIWCLIPAKQGQCPITCAAVSLAQPHWQAGNSTPGTRALFNNNNIILYSDESKNEQLNKLRADIIYITNLAINQSFS